MNRNCGSDTRSVWTWFWREISGAAAVEFALVFPVVILILFGTIEMGRAWNVRQVLTDTAREGARVAAVGNGIVTPTTALRDSIQRVIRRSAARSGLDTTTAYLTITPTGVGGGAGTPVTVALEYQYDPLFGSWVLSQNFLRIRATSVMRNE